MKKIITISLLLAVVFAAGWMSGIAKQVLAQTEKIDNPIARTLLGRFLPNVNLLVEDHVEISCEKEFSIKVFTTATLSDASFLVKDASSGNVLFGPKIVKQIDPLWQKVWLGPLNAIPPKIYVDMKARTANGAEASHRLIVEPDCGEPPLTNNLIVWQKSPITAPAASDPVASRTRIVPLVMAVPKQAIGQNLVAAIVWKDDYAGKSYYGHASIARIETEMIALNLTSAMPVTVSLPAGTTEFPPPIQAFYVMGVGEPSGAGLQGALANDTENLPEVMPDDLITHPDGSQRTIAPINSFFDVFYTIEPLPMVVPYIIPVAHLPIPQEPDPAATSTEPVFSSFLDTNEPSLSEPK
jgi:hypothetical protein